VRYLFAIFSASITRISSAKTTKKTLYYDSTKSATSNTSRRNIQFPSKYMSIVYISARPTNTAMFADWHYGTCANSNICLRKELKIIMSKLKTVKPVLTIKRQESLSLKKTVPSSVLLLTIVFAKITPHRHRSINKVQIKHFSASLQDCT
jgi:hypothetical protein